MSEFPIWTPSKKKKKERKKNSLLVSAKVVCV